MKSISLLLMFGCAFFASIAAHAKPEHTISKPEQHYQKIVSMCQSESEAQWDTGITSEMEEGSYDYVVCLLREIEEMADVFFVGPKDDEYKQKFLRNLIVHTESAHQIYSLMFHGACDPCSTINSALHMNRVAVEVENILKALIESAYENDRPLTKKSTKDQDNFWDKKPHPDGYYGYDESLPDLLNIKELSYHAARLIIMDTGWSPVQTLKEGTEDFEQGITLSGDGKLFWGKGYHELQTCTGSGMAFCAFLFQNKNGDRLRVVTRGEEWEESSSFALVAGYRFNP